jgi:hypothetical protein
VDKDHLPRATFVANSAYLSTAKTLKGVEEAMDEFFRLDGESEAETDNARTRGDRRQGESGGDATAPPTLKDRFIDSGGDSGAR